MVRTSCIVVLNEIKQNASQTFFISVLFIDREVTRVLDNDVRLREAVRGRKTFYLNERSPVHAAASRDMVHLITVLAG